MTLLIPSQNLRKTAKTDEMVKKQSYLESAVLVVLGLMILGGLIFFSGTNYSQGIRLDRLVAKKAKVFNTRVLITNMPSGRSVGYLPELQVQYEVDGVEFIEWTRVIRGKLFAEKDQAARILSSFPQGSELMIFIDTTNPSYLLIDRRIDLPPYLGSMFLSLLAMGWFGALSVRLRSAKYPQTGCGFSTSNSESRESGPSYTEHPISTVGIYLTLGLLVIWILFAGLNIVHYRTYFGKTFEWPFTAICILVGMGMVVHVGFIVHVCWARFRITTVDAS